MLPEEQFGYRMVKTPEKKPMNVERYPSLTENWGGGDEDTF